MVSIIIENYGGAFLICIFCTFFTKPPFWHLENGKVVFLCKENENFLLLHCLPFQVKHFCTI
jgi:hypothetical protein